MIFWIIKGRCIFHSCVLLSGQETHCYSRSVRQQQYMKYLYQFTRSARKKTYILTKNISQNISNYYYQIRRNFHYFNGYEHRNLKVDTKCRLHVIVLPRQFGTARSVQAIWLGLPKFLDGEIQGDQLNMAGFFSGTLYKVTCPEYATVNVYT